jgi:hypothetical protein
MTAVEFLLEKYKSQNTLLFAEDFEQAKEMEKEQIVDAWDSCGESFITEEFDNAEQYYNTTFKSE